MLIQRTRSRHQLATLFVALACSNSTAETQQQSTQFTTPAGAIERTAGSVAWPNAPRRTIRVVPVHPEGLSEVNAIVTMQVTLGRDGRVVESRAINAVTDGPLPDGAGDAAARAFATVAINAVNRWQYEPIAKGPVTFMVNLVVRPGAAGSEAGAPGVESQIKADDKALRQTAAASPLYPPAAAAKRIQGIVVVEATIGPDGRVIDGRVLRAIPYLGQAALDAVAQWAFDPQPLFQKRAPGNVTAEFMLNFKLQ